MRWFRCWGVFLLLPVMLAAGCMKRAASAPFLSTYHPAATSASEVETSMIDPSVLRGTTQAPEFPSELTWFNTSRPLRLRELRGKIVLLDFWTYCCINCMHIIPDLKALEEKYPDELVVIGVHSAKFASEREDENIRRAIMRYEVVHPVINDAGMQVWQDYGVNAWPTLMLINPDGRIVGQHSGEGVFAPFDQYIAALVAEYDKQGKLDRTPLKLTLEAAAEPERTLAFPGKMDYAAATASLALSDSNHNRILVLGLDGVVQHVIGGTAAGFADGDFAAVRFSRPQGVCFDPAGRMIYVADTENHAVRIIDLQTRTVVTLAGTGEQAFGFERGKRGTELGLSSPWDLALVDGVLYVAMAGTHQIWAFDPASGEGRVHAGSGAENISDGPLRYCALAQPSGICSDGAGLYFADSEVSAVRIADLAASGEVSTLIGTGLFDFGDIDGAYPAARLQHPLGVDWRLGKVYVADSYNHKVKAIDPATRTVETLCGSGAPGAADGSAGEAQFHEPADICWAGDKLYIADTDNHAVRMYDPATGLVSTVTVRIP